MNAPQRLWTPMELIRVTAEFLADKGIDSPRLDAELLLAHVLDTQRLQLYLDHDRPVVSNELARYRELVRRRSQREPLQRLVGSATLLDHDFSVREGVFIPRPDTETLLEICYAQLGAEPGPLRIVEVGVGTGCIGLSLLAKYPAAQLVGFDVNPAAVDLSRHNAERLAVSERATLEVRDALRGEELPDCDLLVSNPPYIAEGDLQALEPEVRDHEPVEALTSGVDGLDAIRALARRGMDCVAGGGRIVLEHGADQGETAPGLLRAAGWVEVTDHADLAGRSRVVSARHPS